MNNSPFDERILILAPVAGDASAMATLLMDRGFAAAVCHGAAQLCALMAEGAGALLLTEEALERAQLPEFLDQLQAQPSWSELPLIILTQGGESRLARLLDTVAAAAGGITLLERPIATATLVRTVEVAVRTRRRQYQVRDLIHESASQIAALKENELTIRSQETRLRKVERLAVAGQLAASLAHEINNPLESVTNALYILQNFSNLPAETAALVNTASSELARVSRIVKQSLSYYRVGRSPREIDLAQILEVSLSIFEEKFRKAGLHVRAKIHPHTTILGFEDEVRQVIDNLLLNAVEATPKNGRMVVSLHPSTNRQDPRLPNVARLTIADSGSGVPRDQVSRLFEPFFSTKAEKGTGLGLWIVQGIVNKHEGSIRIRSSTKEGRAGTAISILWPLPRRGFPALGADGQTHRSALIADSTVA